MAGRPDFSQPGTRGSGQKVAVSNRPEIKEVNATQTGSVGSGTTEVTEVYAPTGSIYSVFNAFVRIDADATWTSGDHLFYCSTAGYARVMRGRSNYTAKLRFQHSYWMSADAGQDPTDDANAFQALQSLRASENAAIKLVYVNKADAAQDNDRQYRLMVEESSY